VLMLGVWGLRAFYRGGLARAGEAPSPSPGSSAGAGEPQLVAPCPNFRGFAFPVREEGDYVYFKCHFCNHEFPILSYEGFQRQKAQVGTAATGQAEVRS